MKKIEISGTTANSANSATKATVNSASKVLTTVTGAVKATVNEMPTPTTETAQPDKAETTTVTGAIKATVNGVPTPQTETVTAAPTTETVTAAPTTETVTVTVTPKTETIEELKQRLEIELNRLNHKKQLAANREKFINSMGSLQLYIDDLKNENEFETKSGKLTFAILADNYNRPNFVDTFSISNTALIMAFCKMLYAEMEQKVTSLETELLTA